MERKGQAAMEFLMTYGWAILAAIIAIGVLAYFGVFSPERLASSTGVLNAPFNMDTFAIVSDSTDAECGPGNDCIRMEITQNAGTSVNTWNAPTITPRRGISGTPTWTCTLTPLITTIWTTGEKRTLECNTGVATSWEGTNAVSADITLSYRTTGSGIDQTSSGSVRGTSQ